MRHHPDCPYGVLIHTRRGRLEGKKWGEEGGKTCSSKPMSDGGRTMYVRDDRKQSGGKSSCETSGDTDPRPGAQGDCEFGPSARGCLGL